MKILYYFQELGTPMFQWQRLHFLDELLRHGIEIETYNPLMYTNPGEANEKLLEHIKKEHFDLFVSNLGYYKMLYVETVEEIKRLGVPTLRIAWDNLMVPYLDKVLAPHFDLVWLTAQETKSLYDKWGVNSFFAPYAANPYKYTYSSKAILRNVCFIGNPHGSRALMINELTDNNIPVTLYHGGSAKKMCAISSGLKYDIINPSTTETLINRLKFKEGRELLYGSFINKIKGSTFVKDNPTLLRYPGLSHDEMVDTYSASVLSLASTSAGHTDILKTPLPIINLRNFEIPMCGGIEICKYNEELASYFEDGKEIVFYKTEEELVDKARYYVEKASDVEVLKIKESARKRAESDHSWMKRFDLAFHLLGLNHY